MLLIYLCDDIKEQLEKNRKIIENFLLFKDWDIKIACITTNPQDVLSNIDKTNNMGLYFLDVNFKSEIDGFILAEKIRQLDPRGFIVFVTTHSECCHIPYEHNIEAMNYILKDSPIQMKFQIEQCLTNTYNRYTSAATNLKSFLIIKSFGITTFIKFDDIIRIQTSNIPHQIDIYKTNGVLSVYEKLRVVENNLDERFFRIHKSIIINMEHIHEILHNIKSIKMDDGSIVATSAPKLRDLILIKMNK